jgi:hypothetical protein
MAETPIQSLAEGSGDATGQVVRSHDPIADVAKLLSQQPAAAEPSPETGDQAEPPDESLDIKTLAERLKVDPAKLYADLKVAFDDGTELSVSALKDAYRPAAELEKARGKLWEEVTTSKRAVAEAQQELQNLLRHIDPQVLTPDVLAENRRQLESARSQETARLIERVPEWKDPIARAADWADIRRVGQEYGYTPAELQLAEEGYADHRLVATLRALARGPKAKAPDAKPAPKVAVKPAGKARTPAQQFGQVKAAVKSGRISPFAAVAQLIGEK